jgi:hypothetical protein
MVFNNTKQGHFKPKTSIMNKISLALLLFSAAAILSCHKSNIESVRKELLQYTGLYKNKISFNFEETENDSNIVAFFKNKSVGKFIFLSTLDTSVLVEFCYIKSKNRNSSKVYQSSVVKKDSLIFLEVIDLKRKFIKTVKFPIINPVFVAPGMFHSSIEACLSDYYESQEYFSILAQVNRTCEPSPLVGPCCHLTSGSTVCIDLIIKPTRPYCLLVDDFAILQSRIPPIFLRM